MKNGKILSIDQSTSGTKGLVWGIGGELLARADVTHRQITNDRGWVEHDPEEIYQNTLKAAKCALSASGAKDGEILAIGISNQRETAVCWDGKTGKPLHNAIVWQCARAMDITSRVKAEGMEGKVREKSGLILSPYFSAAKFGWMIENSPEVAAAARNGRLRCATVDSWLIHKLTGRFATDYSNASRTQLMNLNTLEWDDELTAAFGVGRECLPEICFSDSLFGFTDMEGILPCKAPIHGVMGDSHAALFANRCWEPYEAKATYGTGSSVMINVGKTVVSPGEGIAASVGWGMGGNVEYVLEGNINHTGAVIKWLVEGVGLLPEAGSAGATAARVKDNGGVYLVPAFSGLGAPYYNDMARAAFVGMNMGTRREHLVRAAQECIAYQIRDVTEAVNACTQRTLDMLRVDGGPTRDGFLMKFQADMLGIPVRISETEELSGMGTAYCAAIGAGITQRDAIFAGARSRDVMPGMPVDERERLYAGWKNAVKMINV